MTNAYGMLLFFYRRWLKSTKTIETPPEDVINLFREFSEPGTDIMPIDKLCKFLDKEGVEDAKKTAQEFIASRNLKGFSNYHRKGLSRHAFLEYLLSRNYNPPLVKEKLDETAPLTHYFVYTSHTSYLKLEEEGQIEKDLSKIQTKAENVFNRILGPNCMVLSPSTNTPDENKESKEKKKIVHVSITAIEKALQRGVRVIELDLWWNPNRSEFDLPHPVEPDSSVALKKCLEAIKEKAFVASKFPLIIVLVQNLDSDESHVADLWNWIMYAFSVQLCSRARDLKAPLESLKKKFIFVIKRHMKQEQTQTHQNESKKYIEMLEGDFENVQTPGPGKPKPTILSLTEDNLAEPTILSLTEDNLEKAPSSCILNFTRDNLLAVYPETPADKKLCFTSNYDPFIGWTRGAQMVAFNMRDRLKDLWIMQGLFRSQSNKDQITGYVKKPDILIKQNQFNPTSWRPVKKILKVKVYLGFGWHLDFDKKDFDDSSRPDFFAAVEIVGVPADEAREKTVPVMDEWIPMWNQEFEFPLTVPELAMLVIEVKEFDPDRTHDFGGQNCLPVTKLKNGIRSVPLYDEKGNLFRAAKLLVHFHLQ